jgi:hypothetical protein
MRPGISFTVQGKCRTEGDDDAEIEAVFMALDASGATDAAVSAGDGWVGITTTYTAKDADDALSKFNHALLLDESEVLL